ncbi:peptide MFS transporter [Prosthecobacter sp.]|uniref:peptide MFS transporter n=1 Tax=Prosthecobacter sp. TaxID=1965333 RepID=UPI002AB84003|nr:peptide MFS transporter [Prosthecobacter sp.]MDZ4404587.1 peptide MFS transporter [Prosthecobacter sp.]
MTSEPTGHPRGIYTLFFTEMWERFSYYGMRALLVLYMVAEVQRGGMGLTDEMAAAIYGLYTALVYMTALPGGWVGDRLLGAKSAVWWGGVIIACGHLVLGIHRTEAFFIGLILVAFGSGLLKSNMSALVGQLYPEGGARRDAGFTLFYMGINLGAFLGQMLCGWLGEGVGWRWGFSAAAVGMFLGLVQFKATSRHVMQIGERVEHAGQNVKREWILLWLSLVAVITVVVLCVTGVIQIDVLALAKSTAWFIGGVAVLYFLWAFLFAGLDTIEKKRLVVIVVLFLASALFWAGFEQVGSSFSIFAERFTIRQFGSWEVPASWVQALNPLCVIGLAPVVAGLWSWLARRGTSPSLTTKVSWSLLMLALGFVVAAMAARHALSTGPVWPTWLMSVVVIHTLGELFLSPVGLSAVTKLSPPRLTGQMMGIWFLGSALGDILAGLLAGEVTGDATAQMPARFMEVAVTAGISGLVLLLLARWITKLMPGIK